MATTRLSETELTAWRLNLMSWKRIERELDRQLLRDSGIPHAYYAILVLLAGDDEPIPLARLASQLDYSTSRMSHAVDRLEHLGWIERVPDESDGRVTLARLTPTGRTAYTRASVGHLTRVREVFIDPLDERDLADVTRIAGKLLTGFTP